MTTAFVCPLKACWCQQAETFSLSGHIMPLLWWVLCSGYENLHSLYVHMPFPTSCLIFWWSSTQTLIRWLGLCPLPRSQYIFTISFTWNWFIEQQLELWLNYAPLSRKTQRCIVKAATLVVWIKDALILELVFTHQMWHNCLRQTPISDANRGLSFFS